MIDAWLDDLSTHTRRSYEAGLLLVRADAVLGLLGKPRLAGAEPHVHKLVSVLVRLNDTRNPDQIPPLLEELSQQAT